MGFFQPVSLDFLTKNIAQIPLSTGLSSLNGAAVVDGALMIVGSGGDVSIIETGVPIRLNSATPITAILWGICASGNRAVVCSQSAGFMYSDDKGASWTKSADFPLAWCTAIAANGNTVVATERNTRHAFVSLDGGETWTQHLNAFTTATPAVSANHCFYSVDLGLFVVGDTSGALNFSPDGLAWTNSTAYPNASLICICEFDQYIYCGADNSGATGGHMWRYNATSGWENVTWNIRNAQSGGTGAGKYGMAVINNRLFVLDSDGFAQSMSHSESVIVSSGGIGATANASKFAIVYDGELYVARLSYLGKSMTA